MENEQYVITISHQKGGVGKSTVALNLAVEMSKKHNVIIIDLDHQRSMTIFQKIRNDKHGKDLNVVDIENDAELMDIMNNYDGIVIIDSGGFDSDLNRIAMLGSDLIITPVSNSMIELYGLEKFKLTISELKKVNPDLKAHILLNNISPSATRLVDELQSFILEDDRFDTIKAILRQRVDYRISFEQGLSVVEMNPDSKAANEVRLLVENVEEQLFIST